MIYDSVKDNDPLRQGDIFYPLPFSVINLDEIKVPADVNFETRTWEDISGTEKNLAVLPIQNVWGIIASQDCDNARADNISLFLIRPFSELIKTPPKDANAWQSWITRKSRENANLFFLPKDNTVGFGEKMLVSFEEVFQVSRLGLEKRRSTHRKGRLNDMADEHFRESIAQFFRRYPYEEWYSLEAEELEAYNAKKEQKVSPLGGQKPKG